jgi:serine/threonine protein kinase
MALAAGVRLGPYEILALLGAGGMGEVYKARDIRLNRIVALKTLPAAKGADADWKRRFLHEAQAASRLNHPNIVTIHDISEENGVCFMAMEYVAGATLECANTGSGVPLKCALKYAAEIADALAAAHTAGILRSPDFPVAPVKRFPAPPISRRGEEGSRGLAHSCHRAVAVTRQSRRNSGWRHANIAMNQ